MTIRYHFMNATGSLLRFQDRISKATEKVLPLILAQLPIDQVDIVYHSETGRIVPEVGSGGLTFSPNLVLYSINPANPNFDKFLEEEIPGTIAHELHHCARSRSVGYGNSLPRTLISEGLARKFEQDIRGGTLPPYHTQLTLEQCRHLLPLAESEFGLEKYLSHGEWFFDGNPARGIPPFAGFSLGHRIVESYVNLTGKTAAELVDAPASDFFSPTVIEWR